MKPFKTWITSKGHILQKFERRLRKRSKHDTVPDYTRVLVLPLNNVEALVQTASHAYIKHGQDFYDNRMRSALASVGVVPAAKKGPK